MKFLQNYPGISGDTIHQLRDHFIGEEKGLRHLAAFLKQFELDLREKIKEQENKERQK